jgi:putrescine aminotransferase
MTQESNPVYERHASYINPGFVSLLKTLGYGRTLTSAEGVYLYDTNNKSYLDMLSGFGSVPLGYNHPTLIAEIYKTLEQKPISFLHVAPNPLAGELAQKLATRLGALSISSFTNSGTEAVEGALKVAYAATRRTKVLYCIGAYHGLTLGALSCMGSERLRAPFPSLPGCEPAIFGSLEGLEGRLKTKTYAAFIIEPILIEGGVRMASNEYFQQLSRLCHQYGTALIFDEVQTGMGRTGSLFAYQQMGMTPDILVYAKAMSGGLLPIGGYSTTPEWFHRAYGRGQNSHSSTFGGNALSCAVASKLLDLLDDILLAKVQTLGELLGESLRAISSPVIKEVRGQGLIWGVQFAPPTKGITTLLTLGVPNAIMNQLFAHWVAVRLIERGFITETTTHNEGVLRVEPPLTINKEQLTNFTSNLAEVLQENESFVSFIRQSGGRLLSQLSQR